MKLSTITAALLLSGVLVSCGKPRHRPVDPPPPPPATAAQKAEADRDVFAKVDRWKQLRSQAIVCDQNLQRDLAQWKAGNTTWSEEHGRWIAKDLKQMPDQGRCLDADAAKEIALAELVSLHDTLYRQGRARQWSYYLGPEEQ